MQKTQSKLYLRTNHPVLKMEGLALPALLHAGFCGTAIVRKAGRFQPVGAAAPMVSLRQPWRHGLRLSQSADCTHLSGSCVSISHLLEPSCPQSLLCPQLPSTRAQQTAASKLSKRWLSWSRLFFSFFLSSEQILLEYLRKHNNTLVVSWGNGPTFAGKRHGADLAGLPRTSNTWYCTECLTFIKCHSKTKLCWHNERRRSFQYICVLLSFCLQRWPFVPNDKLALKKLP